MRDGGTVSKDPRFDLEDPLVGLILGRNPQLTDTQVAVLKEEWWIKYGFHLAVLGGVARDSLSVLDNGDSAEAERAGAAAAALLFNRTLLVGGTESPGLMVMAALSELDEHIRRSTDADTLDAGELRELFQYLMRLGRINPNAV